MKTLEPPKAYHVWFQFLRRIPTKPPCCFTSLFGFLLAFLQSSTSPRTVQIVYVSFPNQYYNDCGVFFLLSD
ncbi:unnamed protein product [Brassica rapa subsp. narinosa]